MRTVTELKQIYCVSHNNVVYSITVDKTTSVLLKNDKLD